MVMLPDPVALGAPEPFSMPISLKSRAEVGGVPTLISKVLVFWSMMTLTGTFIPAKALVFSLIFGDDLYNVDPRRSQGGAQRRTGGGLAAIH